LPSERIITSYVRLFELRLLHHYWLDSGVDRFDDLLETTRQQRLLTYNVRAFLEIVPTALTKLMLTGLRGVFCETRLGAVIAVPKVVVVPDDVVFEFVVRVRNAAFYNYTSGTLGLQEAKVALFSNLTGSSRGVGLSKTLYLSQEYPAIGAQDTAESLVNVAGTLVQLMSDQPGATQHQLAALAANSPVYTHQGDVPTPSLQITEEMGRAVFAVIRIAAVCPGKPDFTTTQAGVAKLVPPMFQIRFKNRLSVWRYFNKTNPASPLHETGPFPLTHFGNASTEQKPSAVSMIKVDKNGTSISKMVSEVFI